MKALVYDIEIIKAIPDKGKPRIEGIEYCEGWGDKANMGISVIGAYDYEEDRYRVFCEDNKEDFFEACEKSDILVTWNGTQFDDPVIAACWGKLPGTETEKQIFDIMAKMRKVTGERASLDATCEKNFGICKSGNGAMAPVLWQRGEIGKVIDYCLHDVRMTKLCLDKIVKKGFLLCPKTDKRVVMVLREIAE